MKLSQRAKSLWAKTPNRYFDSSYEEGSWLPLYVHMADAAEVAKLLWDEWVPPSVKSVVARGVLSDDDAKTRTSAQISATSQTIGHGDDIAGPEAIATSLDEERYGMAKRIFVFLAAAHDLGKAIPAFQMAGRHIDEELLGRVMRSGLPIPTRLQSESYRPHPLASQMILERNGIDRSYAVVLGGHHGKPPTLGSIRKIKQHYSKKNTGFGDKIWTEVQEELFGYALSLAGMDDTPHGRIDMQAQVVLSGLVIMADWLASDSDRFILIAENGTAQPSSIRAADAWNNIKLPPYWEAHSHTDVSGLFKDRFGGFAAPRPVQSRVAEIVNSASAPGVIIIEAPMGEGKTEAALAAAEIMAAKSGCGGLFFALPTMATSDGMFGRVKRWAERIGETSECPNSIFLAHGKAHLNEDFVGIGVEDENVGDEGEDNVVVNDWTKGRKKGMLANFVVGTIDQALFMALKMRHLALRHLALAGKVIVIDECHAFDAYMNGYLMKALQWLGSYKAPVVILSATLPENTRRQLIEAYLGNEYGSYAIPDSPTENSVSSKEEPAWAANRAYPLVTYTDGGAVKQEEVKASAGELMVSLEYLDDEHIAAKLDLLLENGGCVGVICDTVSRAQEKYELLKKVFGEDCVRLVHSRFLSVDRVEKEKDLRRLLGPEATLENGWRPQKLIVVGTQVLEQSLDIDFDVLVSDIAPMDLLIQRIGRLHRHKRAGRPQNFQVARCFITGVLSPNEMNFKEAIEKIYPRYLLMNTVLLLSTSITLPSDISHLVQNAYDDRGLDTSGDIAEKYALAKNDYDSIVNDKKTRARDFQIGGPSGGYDKNMVGWIDIERNDTNDKEAEASVRDTEDSLEVIMLWRDADKRLRLFPWIEEREGMGNYELNPDYTPDESVARVLASCTVNLPIRKDWQIDLAIKQLEEEGFPAWQKSYWLAGELFLILDEEMYCDFIGYSVRYSWETGLEMRYTKKESGR
ncbi:MAG: CRISPR-associated helicase Cas3' [Clostridiales Family XIII bacterium]|nr:CRISPR-associated helicase Cas3' [Clostridiales Family XIII bacterium]